MAEYEAVEVVLDVTELQEQERVPVRQENQRVRVKGIRQEKRM